MKLLIACVLILLMIPFASSQTTNQKISEESKQEQEFEAVGG